MNKYIRVTALVLAVLLVVLSAPVQPRAATFQDTDRIIVSMGDSYSSGEGIEPFYGQDLNSAQKVKDQDWLAHRSKDSWPGLLTLNGVAGSMAHNRNTNWYFVAASGATTAHLDGKQNKDYDYDGYSGKEKLPRQLAILEELKEQGKRVDYVTITIGGNDAHFKDIITVVGKEHSTTNSGKLPGMLKSLWEEYKSTIRENLVDSYTAISEAAPGATIIVVSYPLLFESTNNGKNVTGEGALINKDEAKMINDAVHEFNGKLEGLVEELINDGMAIRFVSVEEAFHGHEAYAEDSYINPIYIGRKDEDIKGGFSSYSMHPNSAGARAYARCVQEMIDQLEEERGFDQLKIPVKDLSRVVVKENGQIIEEYNLHYTGDLLTHINVSHPVSGLRGTLRFSYDSAGRVTDVDNGELLALYGKRTYTYDSSGNKTDVKIYWYGATIPTERYTYEYDAQGELTSSQVYYMNPDSDTSDHFATYTYTNTYQNGRLAEQCRTVKWIEDDFRIVCPFGEFYESEMLALTRYTYRADGTYQTEKFVEIPNSLYDPGGNHAFSASEWHTTTYNYAYAPVVIMETDGSHQLVIYDQAMNGLWSIYFGDASYVMDDDHYISKVTDKDTGYTFELTFVD